MRPADQWAPTFTQFFSDDEVVRVTYAISVFSYGTFCKLCDAWITGLPEAHMEEHARDLADWRACQNEVRAATRAEALRRVREERGHTPAKRHDPSEPLTQKQLISRVRNARWKLAHPERYKSEEWSESERKKIQSQLDEAVKAVEDYGAALSEGA